MKLDRLITRRRFLGLAGVGAAGAATAGYGYAVEAGWLEQTEVTVRITRRRPARPVRILHLSDLHASRVVPAERIDRAVTMGLEAGPDMACLTGDFVTTRSYEQGPLCEVLERLPRAVPTYACLGNHDGGHWARARGGHEHPGPVIALLRQAGVEVLVNAARLAAPGGQRLWVVGLGDIGARDCRPDQAFAAVPAGTAEPVLVLTHNPDSKALLAAHDWDLALCGHTHGGQLVIPFLGRPFLPIRDRRFAEGLLRWEGRWIHVTRGVGSIFGIRVNCRPQVSLVTLT